MGFIMSNWSIMVAMVCVVVLAVQRILEFLALPTEKKIAELKERLLEWVRKAEADLGGGTGKFKLAQVYDQFCDKYPELKKHFTLAQFEAFVDEALEQMEDAFANGRTKMNALKLGG